MGRRAGCSPHYVRIIKHKLPGTKNKTITVKSGTQVIDRCWRFLKERVRVNQHTKAGSSLLRAKLRSAQYEYWNRSKDLWLACGELCSHVMRKFLSQASFVHRIWRLGSPYSLSNPDQPRSQVKFTHLTSQ